MGEQGWQKKHPWQSYWHLWSQGNEQSKCKMYWKCGVIKELLPEPPHGANICPNCLEGE